MVSDSPRPVAAVPGYLRMLAVVVTLFGLSTAMRAAQALLAPVPGAVAPALLAAALLVAIASTVIAWLRPRYIALAIIGIPLGVMLASWDLFDDPGFAATIAVVPIVLATLIAAWAYLVLPLLAWRQVRMPARLSDAFRPCADVASLPAPLRMAIAPLVALGFEPIASLQEAGDAPMQGALLFDTARPVSATVFASMQHGLPVTMTKLSAPPGAGEAALVSVADRAFPEFLPLPDNESEYLFPGLAAPALLANLLRLAPRMQPMPARSRDEWMTQLTADKDTRLQWWIARGWVEQAAVAGQHRITLRGAFAGVWRMLWPGRAIIAARRRREGAEALRRV